MYVHMCTCTTWIPIWSCVQVKLQLNVSELREEIAVLGRQQPHPLSLQFNTGRRSSLEPVIFPDPTLSLLLQWCRAVGTLYGVSVSRPNFLSSLWGVSVWAHSLQANNYYFSSVLHTASTCACGSNCALRCIQECVVLPIMSIQVCNFTTSFSDGRLLCYLIHHYHPSLLPLHLIHNYTTLSEVSPLTLTALALVVDKCAREGI